MAFVVRTAKKIRNNWKKSTFAALVITYGYNWTKEHFQTQELMRVYCQKAAEFGRQPVPIDKTPKTITVILNPNANKRSANDDFESYCAPILNLAGFIVNVVKTESEGHAKKLVQELNNTDAIVVAGGDGTLCEVVTGLLRRTEENTTGLVPIGVLPLGKHNSVATTLFPGGAHLEKVRSLVDASMAIVEEATKPVDVMKVEIVNKETEENPKPIYALSGLKWGAFRDAEISKDKYWYYGFLRKYATYVFNGYKSSLTWKVAADITYNPPCTGCSNCLIKKVPQNQKWFHRFSKEKSLNNDLSKTLNPECSRDYEKKIETSDFTISTSNIITKEDIPKLQLSIGPKSLSYIDFVKEGWKSENKEKRDVEEEIDARVVQINPNETSSEAKESWFSIDNDNFEVRPIKITLLPKFVTMFCKKEKI